MGDVFRIKGHARLRKEPAGQKQADEQGLGQGQHVDQHVPEAFPQHPVGTGAVEHEKLEEQIAREHPDQIGQHNGRRIGEPMGKQPTGAQIGAGGQSAAEDENDELAAGVHSACRTSAASSPAMRALSLMDRSSGKEWLVSAAKMPGAPVA